MRRLVLVLCLLLNISFALVPFSARCMPTSTLITMRRKFMVAMTMTLGLATAITTRIKSSISSSHSRITVPAR